MGTSMELFMKVNQVKELLPQLQYRDNRLSLIHIYLQCDYVDLYFIHWPFPNYHAPGCDVDSRNPDSRPFSVDEFMDTYRQCEELVEKGVIRYIGISNMTIPKLEAVLPLMKIKPAACELELHVCFQQQELYDYLVAHNIQPVSYTHLDVYKRQGLMSWESGFRRKSLW